MMVKYVELLSPFATSEKMGLRLDFFSSDIRLAHDEQNC